MKKFRYFVMNNIKRLIIIIVTLALAISAMTFGSIFYTVPNAQIGTEYAGGFEYVVEIDPNNSDSMTDGELEDYAQDVAQSIYERIDSIGNKGVIVDVEMNDGANPTVRVQYPYDSSASDWELQKDLIEEEITKKPHLVMTDFWSNPLFTENGYFNPQLHSGITGSLQPPQWNNYSESRVPLKGGGASPILNSDGSWNVQLTLESDASLSAWQAATSYITSIGASEPAYSAMPIWINLDDFIDDAINEWPDAWNSAGGDPYMYAHVEESLENELKVHQVDAAKYLISDPVVSSPMYDKTFVIEGNFNQVQAQNLSQAINFGISDYSLNTITSNVIDASYGENSFNKAIIAGLIVMALIAVFLIASYGILGAISAISVMLFVFLTLTFFTILNGTYTPETIASLIIGIGMAVDANIITFERLKNEYYQGATLQKANNRANRRTIRTIMDSNITTVIVAFILFYFGTRAIIGLSVTLILSILFTLVVLLAVTNVLSRLIINSGKFNDKPGWLGMHSKFDKGVQGKINTINFTSKTKWFAIGSAAVIGMATIVFSVFAGITQSFGGGFNLSTEFLGGTNLSVHTEYRDGFSTDQQASILGVYDKYDLDAELVYSDTDKTIVSEIRISTTKTFTASEMEDMSRDFDFVMDRHATFNRTSTSAAAAQALTKDALIAIAVAFAAIVLYVLVRFRWTYAFSAIVALVHDGLIVTAVFIIFRAEISPVFIAALLSTVGYSINDTIVTFDRIREKINQRPEGVNVDNIVEITNGAIKDTFKRSIITSVTTMSAVVVLMSFGNATKLSFNLAMLVGLISGTYSSIFIASTTWIKLEKFRLRRQAKRKEKKFWDTHDIEEQTFDGINDFAI